MAFLQRHLISASFVLLATISAGQLCAESESSSKRSVVFRTFSAALDAEVTGLFYDNRGKQTPLAATNHNLSQAYVSPSGGLLAIYRELPPIAPEQKPRRVPVADVQLESGGPWLVLLSPQANTDNAGQPSLRTLVIDQAWKTHPVATVNILNLCQTPVTIQLGEETVELPRGQSRLQPYPKTNHLWLKVAVLTDGHWQARLNAPQRIAGMDTRATWVLFDRPITLDNPVSRIIVRNLVEPAPTTTPGAP